MLIPKIEARVRQYLAFLDARKYEKVADLAVEALAPTEEFFRAPPDGPWTSITIPHSYGKEWSASWFRSTFALPRETAGREVYLHATTNADTLAFVNGEPAGAVNPLHEKLLLTASGEADKAYTVHLEAYAGHSYAGMHPLEPQRIILTLSRSIPSYPIVFEAAELLVRNKPVYSLYYDALVLFELAQELPPDSLRRNRILHDLYAALMRVRFTARGAELAAQAAQADQGLAAVLAARNGDTTPEVFLVGHAHIDHAWLWPIAETERKAARTFANMCRLAEEFPEFHFIQSQPAQLDAMRRLYPAVFQAVKKAYARGQWEPNGGMWIEADCNIPSGESLIRQFLVGKQATRAMLDYEGDTLWLPDVFGYAAALPQILAGCEISYFVTSKINWNDTTRFPYDTFLWCGIDGTSVRTHFITSRVDGYNGKVKAKHLFDSWKQVQHKEVQSALILPVGEGDGGGGTMRADLESARRLSNLEGAPRARWTKVSDALRRIFENADDLPRWRGELYRELHRGTYTTQAHTKRYNRTLELSLRECELLYATLSMLGDSLPYPKEEMEESWKRLLTNQFHDIIPGSSITRVYQDAEASYREIEKTTGHLIAEGRRRLGEKVARSAGKDTPVVLFNSLSWPRTTPALLPWSEDLREPAELLSESGEGFPVQTGVNLDDAPEAFASAPVPQMGAAAYHTARAKRAKPSAFSAGKNEIETPFYRIVLDDARRIVHLVDKSSEREVVQDGEALNRLVSAEDVPVLWDAWDVDSDWTASIVDEDRLESSEIVSDGPVFLQVRSRYRIGERSRLVQDMLLYAGQRRIDFRTRVDWHESHRILKAVFPINVMATQARCEVQYGHVTRSTTMNLPNDRARFEFCAHKWICVEEAGYGAALLNDCKYGHDVQGARMRLTLLRSPKAPDPEADMGTQVFTYALLPYAGAFSVETVVRAAYELNVPIGAVKADGKGARSPATAELSVLEIDCPDVIIEVVKPSEPAEWAGGLPGKHASHSLVAVRLYEAGGGARRAHLRTSASLAGAWETNMLERAARPLEHDAHSVALSFRPFEIKTLKLEVGS
jgi:alpha-mannosidase